MKNRSMNMKIVNRRIKTILNAWKHWEPLTKNSTLKGPIELRQQNRLKKSNLNCKSTWCHPKTRVWGLPIRDERHIPADSY